MRFGLRETFFVLVLMALLAVSYFFVLQPLDRRVVELRRQKTQKQAKLDQLNSSFLGQFADLGKEIDKLSDSLVVFEQKLPAEREVEVILKQVWEMAAKHKLQPKSIRTDKPVPAPGSAELPIRMVISGDFDGFYSFMLDLEKLKRITRMTKLEIKKVPAEEGHMEASLVLSIFFESENRGRNDSGKGTL